MPPATITAAALPRLAYSHGPDHAPALTEPRNFRPITTSSRFVKPDPGQGLWTAPVTEAAPDGRVLRTAWTDWRTEEMAPFGVDYTRHTEVLPEPTARVLLINTLPDLRTLQAAYPSEPLIPALAQHRYPDWHALARDGWDAVYLTDQGQWETRLPPYGEPTLYGWDTASVLWLRPAYTVGRRW